MIEKKIAKILRVIGIVWLIVAVAVFGATIISVVSSSTASAASCESDTSKASFDYAYSNKPIVVCDFGSLYINSGYKSNAKDRCNGKIKPSSLSGEVYFKIPERKDNGKCGTTGNVRSVKLRCKTDFEPSVSGSNPVKIECKKPKP
jgi:hypothetical protein